MFCPKPNPWVTLLINTLLVFAVFMLIDFLFYGIISPGPDPYGANLPEKMIFTVILSMAYAHLYNKASRIWRPGTDLGEAFLYKKTLAGAKNLCGASWPKIANGIVFSLLTSTVILMAMAVGALMMSVLYIFVLHGIRGDLALSGSGVLVGQTVLAGVTLELAGKTEDAPDR